LRSFPKIVKVLSAWQAAHSYFVLPQNRIHAWATTDLLVQLTHFPNNERMTLPHASHQFTHSLSSCGWKSCPSLAAALPFPLCSATVDTVQHGYHSNCRYGSARLPEQHQFGRSNCALSWGRDKIYRSVRRCNVITTGCSSNRISCSSWWSSTGGGKLRPAEHFADLVSTLHISSIFCADRGSLLNCMWLWYNIFSIKFHQNSFMWRQKCYRKYINIVIKTNKIRQCKTRETGN